MYDPNKTYFIQVLKNELSKEDSDFISKLYNPRDISGVKPYVAFYVSEKLREILLYPEPSDTNSTLIDPHTFMRLVKLYSIDKEIARLACNDLLKKEYV